MDCLTRRRIGQVIAPLLVILRVVNKSAFTNNTDTSGRLSLFEARNREGFMGDSDPVPNGNPTNSVDRRGAGSYGLGAMVGTTTDSHEGA